MHLVAEAGGPKDQGDYLHGDTPQVGKALLGVRFLTMLCFYGAAVAACVASVSLKLQRARRFPCRLPRSAL